MSPQRVYQMPGLAMLPVHSFPAASPSPPSPHSSPLAPPPKTTLTLPPPASNAVWNDRPRPNDSASDEGNASRFFSSRTSSIGSTNSAGSRSPPRWPTQPHAHAQNPQSQTQNLRSYAMQQHDSDHYDYRPAAPTVERELHVVLPEPWMDAPYVLQMAHTQGWDVVDVRMQPHGAVLVFASPSAAARAFAQVNGSVDGVSWIGAGGAGRVQAHWAGAVGRANEEEMQSYVTTRPGVATNAGATGTNAASKQLEFSIFVGDLAPETTNADLVAVFRNPLLGLRADREPRVIRPFTSCRSAKIMVSPETGVSKGYGFVRFTDEADQQRALIEMQGLYCLSRPMRLSHATAKSKPTSGPSSASNGSGYPYDDLDPYMYARGGDIFTGRSSNGSFGRSGGQEVYAQMVPEVYAPRAGQQEFGRGGQGQDFGRGGGFARHSVSGADAYYVRGESQRGGGEFGAPPRSRSVDAEELFNSNTVLGVEGGRVLGVEGGRSIAGSNANGGGGLSEGARLESARALLGVLNSADPYNTTVFVGGLSGLIAEETLRGFFAPFGEIHYVKIPPGKGCGFVQFVRKADAERAIERMQGFPIGGGKIRLSWGRSQSDKAAQAAAQAAQLGLNLGGLHLNSLSAADSARLFQTLEALGYSSVPERGQTGSSGGGGGGGSGFQQGGGAFQGQQGFQGGFQGQQAGFQGQAGGFQGQGSGFQAQQGSFQLSQPFNHQQSFQNNSSPPSSFSPQGPLSPQQGTFVSQTQFTPSIHPPPSSLYEPSSVGLSRAYTTVGSGFQPFSPDPAPGTMSYGRANGMMGSGERGALSPTSGSASMGHSASAQAHLSNQPYSSRQSLAFEPESFGLGGRERQLTAPAHPGPGVGPGPNMKALNLGLAGMNLSQRREFGLDGGPLSAPMRPNGNGNMNNNNGGNSGGMKPSVSDNNVYIH